MGMAPVSSVVLGVGLAIAGCGAQQNVAAPPATPTPTAGVEVAEKTWAQGAWPFTVPAGTLRCYAEDGMITFASGGSEYGLNPSAQRFGDYRNLDEVSRPAPEGYVEIGGERRSVALPPVGFDRVLERAQRLCAGR